MHNFRELKIWQVAIELVKDIYHLTKSFPQEEKFGLISQIQRSAISIPSNIAEGSGRGSDKDFIRFLDIAVGSAFELETQLIISAEIKYTNQTEIHNILDNLKNLQNMFHGLRVKLKS